VGWLALCGRNYLGKHIVGEEITQAQTTREFGELTNESTGSAEDSNRNSEPGGTDFSWPLIIKDNLAVVAALLSVFFVAIRIIGMAGFNMETAYGILQAGGTANVLVGAALSIVGEVTAVLIFFCAVIRNHVYGKDPDPARRNATLGILVFLSIIEIATGALIFLAGAAFFVLLEFILHRPSRLSELERAQNVFSLNNILPLLIVAGLIVVGSTGSWLPAQEISIAKEKPIVGYVLSGSQQFTVVLLASNETLVYIDSKSILSLKICRQGASNLSDTTLPELLSTQQYPNCTGYQGSRLRQTSRPSS
jgi:hypothetical protein